ncbi:MAG: EscU/YscU/HrcU family type III secretion system export apparatus switch protein [Candidatus Sericytochromatia bacterium]|nr:EscU/YscU/HrcU family type III secretion system export apparatus switch protein [Candidatus Sericytochromatia bacterium]
MDASKGRPNDARRAVALRYEAGRDVAPTVVAAGEGHLADRIVAVAREAGVPVEENPDLAAALAQVEIGTAIPEVLYPVVAELLVFIQRLNDERGALREALS